MIFISHKEKDADKAHGLSKYLTAQNVENYVDVLDDQISSGDITLNIVDKLRKASHLIVIYSEHTEKSMWVPFELGVAYERNNGIGVALWPDKEDAKIDTPEYLDEFPLMKTKSDIDKYIAVYTSDMQVVGMESLNESRNFSKSATTETNYAKSFIDRVKSEIQ
jgi:hypothetical protein